MSSFIAHRALEDVKAMRKIAESPLLANQKLEIRSYETIYMAWRTSLNLHEKQAQLAYHFGKILSLYHLRKLAELNLSFFTLQNFYVSSDGKENKFHQLLDCHGMKTIKVGKRKLFEYFSKRSGSSAGRTNKSSHS